MNHKYKKYRGKKAEWNGNYGIVCGYTQDGYLIMAIYDGNYGLSYSKIVECKGNKVCAFKKNTLGYLYITEEDLLKED